MEKKRDILAWIRTVSVLGVFVIMLVCALVIVPQVMGLVERANTVADSANEIVTRAGSTLDEIDGAMAGLQKASDQLTTEIPSMSGSVQKTMKNVEKDLAGALKSINSVDFEDLNDAIGDLQAVVKPMAAFFGK